MRTESDEQIALFEWSGLMLWKYPELARLVHIPNGGMRNPVVAAKLKSEGVKAGYPDLLLDVPRGGYHGLRIELKREKGGTVSPAQKDWLEFLSTQGYRAVVCNGFEAAKKEIEWYLRLEEQNDKL